MTRDFLIGSCFLERTHLWLSNFRSHLLGRWIHWSTKKNGNINLCHCQSQRTNLWEARSFCVATGIQQLLDTIDQSNYRHSKTLAESDWVSVECSTERYSQLRCADPTPHWKMHSHWMLPLFPALQSYTPLFESIQPISHWQLRPAVTCLTWLHKDIYFFSPCFKHQTIGIIERKQFTKT